MGNYDGMCLSTDSDDHTEFTPRVHNWNKGKDNPWPENLVPNKQCYTTLALKFNGEVWGWDHARKERRRLEIVPTTLDEIKALDEESWVNLSDTGARRKMEEDRIHFG